MYFVSYFLLLYYNLFQGEPSSAINRKRRAWSESDEEDEPSQRPLESSPAGYKENSGESDEEMRGKSGGNADVEEDDE